MQSMHKPISTCDYHSRASIDVYGTPYRESEATIVQERWTTLKVVSSSQSLQIRSPVDYLLIHEMEID